MHFKQVCNVYTCQLFVRYKRETFLPGVRRIFEDDTIISEDSRRSLKSSEEFRSLPKTSEVFRRRLKSYDAYKHELASSAFYFKKSEITRKELSFIHFTHGFRSLHGFELHIFGSCVNQDGNNSHFLIRREKLARRREPAWDRSFQPAGVRLTPKAWELAGILFTLFSGRHIGACLMCTNMAFSYWAL